MNIVIFAGGVGTRLWPLSRKKSPKQFERVLGDKSTLQLSVDRLYPTFSPKDIFISTNSQYVAMVRSQLAGVPKKQILGEPQMRDVGPAVGLVTAILMRKAPQTPMAILWCDHLVKNEALFRKVLQVGQAIIEKEPDKIVFIGQKPRFASQNLGWLEFGESRKAMNGIKIRSFGGLKYRPDLATAEAFYKSGSHAWNLGYFITTPQFIWDNYRQHVPEMYKTLVKIQKAWNTPDWEKTLNKWYPTLEQISFDNAILEKLQESAGYVISEDLEWSDIGAWEALKEALQKSPVHNVTLGNVMVKDCTDSLVYNYHKGQLVITIDMDEALVVNTDDVTLICKKTSVPKIKQLVNSMSGTANDHLT